MMISDDNKETSLTSHILLNKASISSSSKLLLLLQAYWLDACFTAFQHESLNFLFIFFTNYNYKFESHNNIYILRILRKVHPIVQ